MTRWFEAHTIARYGRYHASGSASSEPKFRSLAIVHESRRGE